MKEGLAQGSSWRQAESHRRMVTFATAQAEYHEKRAEYWRRIVPECEAEADRLESGEEQEA